MFGVVSSPAKKLFYLVIASVALFLKDSVLICCLWFTV